MSRLAHKIISASGGEEAYKIEQSCEFQKEDSAFMRRTPGTAGNRRTFTWSAWIKRATTNTEEMIFTAYGAENDAGYCDFMFGSEGKFKMGGWSTSWRQTERLFRDTTSWYHIVVAVDTTQGANADRIKVYVNGELLTNDSSDFSTINHPDQNEDFPYNNNVLHVWGDAYYTANSGTTRYIKSSIAEAYMIDGTAKAASDFGETDSATGQWIPKEYTGSYGHNGFYLPFKTAAATKYAAWFDYDQSGYYLGHTHAIDSLGTKNFTTEGWIYPWHDGASGSYDCIWSCGATQQIYWHRESKMVRVFYQSGGSYCYDNVTSTANVEMGQWCHFAVVRNGNSLTVYTHGVGGTSATSSDSINASTTNTYIGTFQGESGGSQFWGSVYGIRHTIGTARYTSNFTPPTADLTDDIAWDATAKTGVGFLQVTHANSTFTDGGEGHTMTKQGSWKVIPFSPITADVGTDSSGEGNDFAPWDINADRSIPDSPTNNFCTMNPLDTGSYCTVSRGNLTSEGNTSADAGWSHSNFSMTDGSGKWYSEHRVGALFAAGNNYPSIGVSSIKDSYYTGTMTTSRFYPNYCYIRATGNVEEYGSIFTEQSSMDLGSTLAAGDIISIAVDTDNKKIWMGKNGTWNGSGNPGGNSNPTFTYSTATELVFSTQHLKGTGSGEAASSVRSNYGQDSTFKGEITASSNADANGYGNFKYAVPSGFKALCAKNLPTPAVKKPTSHFNTILYTGNDTDDRTLTGVGFQPDLVIIATRNEAANWHNVYDSVRGVSKRIFTNDDNVEIVGSDPNNSLVAFTSDGFTVDDSSGHSDLNASAHTYVAWNWKANGSGSSNTDGTLNTTSTSVNTTAGISIGTYTGEGGVKTVGHGLGKVPALIMVKCRSHEIDWCVYHKGAASSPEDGSLTLNDDTGFDDNDNRWNDTAPTSSVFTIYSSNEVNDSGKTYVYYAFAEIEGFSKFGTYEANASTDGPFVHTGFTPAWVVFKYVDGGSEWWWMLDNKRDALNLNNQVLYANSSSAEAAISSSGGVDFLSNGFKIRATNGGINNANTYIYMAFAEYPFKYANAR